LTSASSTPTSAALVGRDDGDALFRDPDVAQHERQRALADAAEADEDDASGKLDVDLVGHLPDSTEKLGREVINHRPVLPPNGFASAAVVRS